MPKRLLFLLPLLLLLFTWTTQPAAAQIKSFHWERVDVDMTLRENGDLEVVEQQTLSFDSGTFTFGFRTLPIGRAGRVDDIVDIRVSEGDRQYTLTSGQAPYTYSTSRSSDEITVNWYFPPTSGRHTYIFRYTVKGAVQVNDNGDQIFWQAIPADHPALIADSRVTLSLPAGIQPQLTADGTAALVAAYRDGIAGDNVVTFYEADTNRVVAESTLILLPGEKLEIRVQFPHGALPVTTPEWQREEQLADVGNLLILLLSLAIAVGGPLLLLLYWYSFGRDPDPGPVPAYLSEPPDDLPPAIVGALVDEQAELRDLVGSLMQLADRGYLTITELKNDHEYRRTEKEWASGLRPFEKNLLKAFFGRSQSRRLSKLRYKFASKLPGLQKDLYTEMVSEKLFARRPDQTRARFTGIGIALSIIFFVALVIVGSFAADGSSVVFVCAPIALVLLGVAFIWVGRHMPAKTRKGAEVAARWNAFRNYLSDLKRYDDVNEAGDLFARYLPYAVAFGLERRWIDQFEKVPTVVGPIWYDPYLGRSGRAGRAAGFPSGSGGDSPSMPTLEGMSGGLTRSLTGMSTGLTKMLDSTATVMRSTPPSSSSSGGGSFSGGGFSGGGSSGGGSMGFG